MENKCPPCLSVPHHPWPKNSIDNTMPMPPPADIPQATLQRRLSDLATACTAALDNPDNPDLLARVARQGAALALILESDRKRLLADLLTEAPELSEPIARHRTTEIETSS